MTESLNQVVYKAIFTALNANGTPTIQTDSPDICEVLVTSGHDFIRLNLMNIAKAAISAMEDAPPLMMSERDRASSTNHSEDKLDMVKPDASDDCAEEYKKWLDDNRLVETSWHQERALAWQAWEAAWNLQDARIQGALV